MVRLISTIGVLCFLFASRAQADLPFAVKGQWPGYGRGSVTSVAVSGAHAYLAVGDGGVTIVNISDPANPVIVAGFEIPLSGSAFDIEVVDGYAFVVAVKWLAIIDVHNPARPALVSLLASSAELGSIDVVGSFAYVTRRNATSVNVVDLRNLANPRFIGGLGFSDGQTSDAQVVGDFAYLAANSAGLKIVNIADPTNSTPVATYTSLYPVTGVHVHGATAYVVTYDLNFPTSGTLDIVAVSNLANPQRLGRATLARGAIAVRVKQDRAYVVGVGNFEIFDVSDPANPVRVGGVDEPVDTVAAGIELSGNYAFVAGQSAGLLVYDVSGQNAPVRIATVPMNALTEAVHVAGNYAYVADGSSHVRILDVTDAAKPTLISTVTNAPTKNLRIAGNYAYLANARAGLQTLNITDPAHPMVTSSSRNNGDVWDVRVLGAHLFAAGGTRGLQVFSLADPSNPVWTTNVALTGQPHQLTVDGTRAFVASTPDGMVIFDISDPARPVKLGAYRPGSGCIGVDVSGNRAFTVDTYGLNIVDVTDPANPKALGIDQLEGAKRVQVVGNLAYVSMMFRGGIVVDVSNPQFPRPVGHFHPNRSVSDIQVVDGRIYSAELFWGLSILEQQAQPLAFLDSGTFLPDGSFQVRWAGGVGFPQLETSTDFKNWTALTPVQGYEILFTYIYPASSSSRRVFRLVQP